MSNAEMGLLERYERTDMISIDIVRTADGRWEARATSWSRDGDRLVHMDEHRPCPINQPTMLPRDCPMPIWVAYHVMEELTEAYLSNTAVFVPR